MKREKIEALLTPFKSTNSSKESLHHIGSVDWGGNHVFATDGFVLALIPTDWKPEYPSHLTLPNVVGVLPTRFAETPVELDVKSMFRVMFEIPYKTKDTDIESCAVCDDVGEFVIGRESYECKSCTGRKSYVVHEREKCKYVKIFNHVFSASVFEKISNFIALTDEKDVTILSTLDNPETAMVFKLKKSDSILLVMPVNASNLNEDLDEVFKIQ